MKFREVVLAQDSDEWLTWRESGIGASESAILMGALPFQWNDVLELWKLKAKLVESDFVMNEAMQQGKDLEPVARKRYTEITGIEMEAKCCEHHEHPFIKASLDGINDTFDKIVEIKCPGLYKFRDAKQGRVADYYYPQMQQQMACSGALSCDYWVYRENEGGVLIHVPRNEPYIEELVRRAKIFWAGIENKEPVLPIHLGIDMTKPSDPFIAGDMTVELKGHYKN